MSRRLLGRRDRAHTCATVLKGISQLKTTLHSFVDQSDDLMLVISCSDTDTALVHKIIESVDQEQPADIVLRFTHGAKSAAAYVDGVVANVDAQIEGANVIRQNEALSPWPKLPGPCSDGQAAPASRLKATMQHVRGLFPVTEDHRIVWCFVPAEIADRSAYAGVIGGLVPREGAQPWMHSQRIIVRDDRDDPFVVPHLHEQKVAGILVYRADFSIEAILDSMAQSVVDPNVPDGTRYAQLLQLAANDYSHRRYREAIEKYGLCYAYYEGQQQPVSQAMCLGGVGDVQYALTQTQAAKERYQQGLALAAPQGVSGLPVVMLLAAKAGDCCLSLGSFEEAEGYFETASQIAGKLVSLEFKADCMEKIGLARQSRRDVGGAVVIWEQAIGLCKEGDYFIRWRSILEHQVALYRSEGVSSRQREAQRQLDAVEQLCKERIG